VSIAETEYRALLADGARIPELYCGLARICVQSGRTAEALKLWKNALAIDPDFPEAAVNLANHYQQTGKAQEAASLYRRVIANHPEQVAAKYLLGNLLKAQGKIDKAEVIYRQIMTQQPDYTQAHFTFAGIHRYADAGDPHIGAMLKLYQRPSLGPDRKIHLAFALAKAFEDVGDYSRAFEYLQAGNAIRAREFEYRIDGDADMVANIMTTFDAESLAQVKVDAESSGKPIFIIGMPRSGTSLVEKILASHPDVHGGGERHEFYSLGARLFLDPEKRYQYNALASYPAPAFERLGREYVEQIGRLDPAARRITDKLPMNFLMMGLIRLALPNARIIHCSRDARDTCLSIYKMNFTTANYRFAYELKSVARFYKLYEDLMAHWREVFPGGFYEVSYESLTAEPEPEIRSLLAACDLDFHQDCLQFHRSAGMVTTASAVQVRRPIYTSSVGLWRKYGDALAPLLEELGERD
jgi:tetratricopeptide (TPR) repeat protein